MDTTDYKQIAYKLQDDIDTIKYWQAEKDIKFLKEMQQHAIKAFEQKDVTSKEMLLIMITDWIDELDE